MRSTLKSELAGKFMYEPHTREWLDDGNSLEIYFRDLEDDVWQGNTILVDDPLVGDSLAMEVCAVRRAPDGYCAYVARATALEELRLSVDLRTQACSDDKEGVKSP